MWWHSGSGHLVPADVRLLETNDLECDEAILTGEPVAGRKGTATHRGGDRGRPRVCAFMGTIVHQGSGRGVVVATAPDGIRTDRGGALRTARRDRLPSRPAGVLALSVRSRCRADGLHLRHQRGFHRPLIEALLFSLAIAVGITPEMMPAIVTVSLSSGLGSWPRRRSW